MTVPGDDVICPPLEADAGIGVPGWTDRPDPGRLPVVGVAVKQSLPPCEGYAVMSRGLRNGRPW